VRARCSSGPNEGLFELPGPSARVEGTGGFASLRAGFGGPCLLRLRDRDITRDYRFEKDGRLAEKIAACS
jgi:hypothetical protein